ncbi:hypothetical protein [Cellulomonas septica]|uniref:Uncharacterized protein n=1 Tax=Cellulomonas septica TaxID=285080 RepID=A0ABX1K1P0_9CELL|nr:hypothetical protein [Cellulomonas septica]NKY39877.1 hypothetical protein [Cellulomonas septica]
MLTAVDCTGGTCTPSPASMAGYVGGSFLLYGVVTAVSVWICVRIARKAGYSPWLGVLGVLPLVSLVALLVFAFKEWPVEAEVRALRGRLLTAQAVAGSSDPRGRFVAPPAGGGFGDPRFSSAPTVPLYTGPSTPTPAPPADTWQPPQPPPPQRW